MSTHQTPTPIAAQAGSGMEPDGGNLYRPHQMMIHSGRFWRCRHGLTGFAGAFEWVGCKACAADDPSAARQFEAPNTDFSGGALKQDTTRSGTPPAATKG